MKMLLTNNSVAAKDVGLLLLRIVFGFVLVYGHGFEKWSHIISGQEIQFMDPIGIGPRLSFYLAAFAEWVCALLLILGLYTRFASLVLVGNFLVILYVHAVVLGDGFSVLEPRIFYLCAFIVLAITGAGTASLDRVLFFRRS